MRYKWAVAVLILLIAGCSSPGIFISSQEKDAKPKMGTAPVDGRYGLFIAGQSQELMAYDLKAGDALGFDSSNDGLIRWIYAVAGNVKIKLDVTQIYEWRRLA